MVKSLDSDSRGPGYESRLLHISIVNLHIYIEPPEVSQKLKQSSFNAFLRAIFRFFQYQNIDQNLPFIVDTGEGKTLPGKINFGKNFVRNFGTVFLPGF